MPTRPLTALAAVGAAALAAVSLGDTAAFAATPAPASVSAAEPTGCSTGSLPSVVVGVPTSFGGGQALGDRLYHDAQGWHLRVTHPGTVAVVFTGSITSSGGIVAEKVLDEKQDVVHRSADGSTVTFRFVNHGRIDGLDFRTDCSKRVDFSFAAAGHELSPVRVWLGAHGGHPTSNPFVIERH